MLRPLPRTWRSTWRSQAAPGEAWLFDHFALQRDGGHDRARDVRARTDHREPGT